MALERELAAFKQRLPDMLARGWAGQCAIFAGDDLLAVALDYEKALTIGYEHQGLKPFLVKVIEAEERPVFFSRRPVLMKESSMPLDSPRYTDASIPCFPTGTLPVGTGNPQAVTIQYTNYRGETAYRDIVPATLRYGLSPYHEGPQWFIDGTDVVKNVERSFAACDIKYWGPLGSRPAAPPAPATVSVVSCTIVIALLVVALFISNLWWLSR